MLVFIVGSVNVEISEMNSALSTVLSKEQLAVEEDNAELGQDVLVAAPCHGGVLALRLDCIFYPLKKSEESQDV